MKIQKKSILKILEGNNILKMQLVLKMSKANRKLSLRVRMQSVEMAWVMQIKRKPVMGKTQIMKIKMIKISRFKEVIH